MRWPSRERSPQIHARRGDHRRAWAALVRGSRSFSAAACLLPPEIRRGAAAIYAFSRLADDAVDRGRSGDLVRIERRLTRIYRGCPIDDPVDRAFACVANRYAIPQALPRALLDGLSWDVAGRRYATLGDLFAYAARVAATVGAMMALLMGRRDRRVLARACDLGVAMQLTNIARDVGEDARIGRIYLPLQWLADEGIDRRELVDRPRFSPPLGRVVRRLLRAADRLYQRAETGIGRLPAGCRPAIFAARLIYADIGYVIAAGGHDSVSRRAVVPVARKLASLTAALAASLDPPRLEDASPLAETRFIVDAAAAETAR